MESTRAFCATIGAMGRSGTGKRPASEDTITSIKDPRVAAVRAGVDDRRSFLVEGERMLRQALERGAALESVLFLDPLRPDLEPLFEAARLAAPVCSRVTRGVFFKILGLGYETAVEVLALVPIPSHDARTLTEGASDRKDALYLVGMGIQDPRNVGVLVRTADAFAATAFVLSADSAFPWSRQAIRSTTGSIYRLPIFLSDDLASFLGELRRQGVAILGSSVTGTDDCATAAYRFPCAVLLGNETTGLTPELRSCCDALLTIPMSGGAHSLNVTVAGGILLHHAALRRSGRAASASHRDHLPFRPAGSRGT